MKRQSQKRFGVAVSIAMLFPLIPNIGLTAHADEIKTIAGVGTNAIGNPSSSGGGWSYVYFGEYDGSPVKYRVLDKNSSDFGGNTLLLDCDTIIVDKAFDDSTDKINVWGENSLSTWLNNDYITDSFTPVEKAAIFASTKNEPSSDDGNGWWNAKGLAGSGPFGLTFAPLNSQKIFLLDAKEATRPSYGYLDNSIADSNRVKIGNSSTYWWLRSPHSSNKANAGYVYPNVYIRSIGVNNTFGVSPAMNIDMSSILFSSLITGTAGESGAEYKLTIIDDNLSFDITDGSNITQSGATFTVPYTITYDEVNDVAATQISLLITDKEYTDSSAVVLEYSQLSTASVSESSGVINYTVDTDKLTGVIGKDYHVYMFAEAVNSTYKTDYASQLLEISHIHDLTYSLSEDKSSVTASCNNDNCNITEGLTLTISAPEEANLIYDGTEKQASLNTDYNTDLFPDTYVIEYYKDSEKLSSAPVDAGTYKAQVTVGEETAYVEYEIQKADQDAPELSSTNETAEGENDGTITGLTEAMEISSESDTSGYEAVSDISGTGYAAGTYYIRYAADDNHNASPARTIIIEQGEAVYFTVTFDNNDGTDTTDISVKKYDIVKKPDDPVYDGYKFLFWSKDGSTEYDFNEPVTEDITLTAKWEDKIADASEYTVSFDTNGGSEVQSQLVSENEKAVKPDEPTREGYSFTGWFCNGSEFDFETRITSNITLTAVWKENPAPAPQPYMVIDRTPWADAPVIAPVLVQPIKSKKNERLKVKTVYRENRIILRWDKIKGAQFYEIYVFRNGKYRPVKKAFNNTYTYHIKPGDESPLRFKVKYFINNEGSDISRSGYAKVNIE